MIRIDAVWLSTVPLDMRAGTDTALARVVSVFGAAYPHTAYLFANRRANRMKVLVHDGIGIWLAARSYPPFGCSVIEFDGPTHLERNQLLDDMDTKFMTGSFPGWQALWYT